MENIAVILVVSFVVYILALGFYRAMTGKAKSCGCSCSNPKESSCNPAECGVAETTDDKKEG